MKYIILLVALLFAGCGKRPCVVIGHYYDETANDGVVEKDTRTMLELTHNKFRFDRYGNWGKTGDVFNVCVDWFGGPME